MTKLIVAGILCYALVAAVNADRTSPCPKIFEYKSSGPGFWEGELTIVPEYKLHGTWIRLIFDGPVTDVETKNSSPHPLETVLREDNSFLLKSHELILFRAKPVTLQLKVTYKGTEVPSLVQYRLNGRDICQPSDE